MNPNDPEWQRWNARFAAAPEYVFGTEPNAFLARQAPRLRPGQRALAIADGEARNGVWLARQGLSVTSVDFSPAAQEKGRRLAAAQGVDVTFVLSDLDSFDWGQARFDVVAGIFFQFCGPALRDRIFRRMRECLVPGGLLLIEGYTPEQLALGTGGPAEAENLYTEDLLRAAFAEMEILELAAYRAEMNEGSHRGRSALIDLVARK
jgi:SAM-dependent methyltransferase